MTIFVRSVENLTIGRKEFINPIGPIDLTALAEAGKPVAAQPRKHSYFAPGFAGLSFEFSAGYSTRWVSACVDFARDCE